MGEAALGILRELETSLGFRSNELTAAVAQEGELENSGGIGGEWESKGLTETPKRCRGVSEPPWRRKRGAANIALTRAHALSLSLSPYKYTHALFL